MTIPNPINISIFVKHVICKLFPRFEMRICSGPKILIEIIDCFAFKPYTTYYM